MSLIWPVPPDWSEDLTETLEWATEVLRSGRTGSSQRRSLRGAPRRFIGWQCLAGFQERQLLDLMLSDKGAAEWLIPVWPDVQIIEGVEAEAFTLVCETAGRDFVAGGKALLWADFRTWDVVSIDTVDADSLTLNVAPSRSYPGGVRLYPLRTGRITEEPEEEALSDEVGRRKITASLIDFCAWPAAMPTSTVYRNWPVLEWRPEETELPASSSTRLLAVVDNGTAPPAVIDLAERAFRAQRATWQIYGRQDQAAFRSMLYALAGRANPVWVPSWQSDFRVAQAISAGSTALVVEWCSYTRYGVGRAGRQDVCIELVDGRRFCRRITASSEGTTTETLTLNAALGVAVAVAEVRQVSHLRLCALASDTVEITHQTDADGLATCTLAFEEEVE